eukprot:2108269-Amphidinium_carterae.1
MMMMMIAVSPSWGRKTAVLHVISIDTRNPHHGVLDIYWDGTRLSPPDGFDWYSEEMTELHRFGPVPFDVPRTGPAEALKTCHIGDMKDQNLTRNIMQSTSPSLVEWLFSRETSLVLLSSKAAALRHIYFAGRDEALSRPCIGCSALDLLEVALHRACFAVQYQGLALMITSPSRERPATRTPHSSRTSRDEPLFLFGNLGNAVSVSHMCLDVQGAGGVWAGWFEC